MASPWGQNTPFLRKGLAPELELHGDEVSLGIDRVGGRLTLAQPVEPIARIPDNGFGNRFEKHVFPGLRRTLAGREADYPDLRDGWRAQLFTDAVARAARSDCWETVE